MTWFRSDDSLYAHPKVLGIPARFRLAAMGLWQLAGTWSAHYLTEGRIPRDVVLRQLGGTATLVQCLVDAGLWIPVEDGYQFHDWEVYQEAAEDVRKRRADSARRMRESRARKRAAGQAQNVTRNIGVGCATPTRPDPTSNTTTGTYAGNGGTPAGEPDEPTRVERLLVEYREASPRGVPSKVAERLAGEIHQLCRDGSTDDEIRAGLGQLRVRRLGPGMLAALVDELANQPAAVIPLPAGRSRTPTTDDKVASTLALGAQLGREARIAALNATARPASIEGETG